MIGYPTYVKKQKTYNLAWLGFQVFFLWQELTLWIPTYIYKTSCVLARLSFRISKGRIGVFIVFTQKYLFHKGGALRFHFSSRGMKKRGLMYLSTLDTLLAYTGNCCVPYCHCVG